MRAKRSINRLQLGPVIGFTDHASVRIWIQVYDDPDLYDLRIQGVGVFRFVSTENGLLEFRTAIAVARGLRPDRIYSYQVLRRGRFVPGARGRVRTMPDPSSMTDILFLTISCNSLSTDGAWNDMAQYIEDAQPLFLVMMGDQVYIDEDEPNVFKEHFQSESSVRRKALAEKYRLNWSREVVRRVLANIPTYMIWDDHEIRDGWGSFAQDSPTMVNRFPKGEKVFNIFNAWFEDTRDVYWHFQGCHNPLPLDTQEVPLPNYIDAPPLYGQRRAMPFAFRVGRLVIVVIDSRGERDVFRKVYPILGSEQWHFIDQIFENLPADVEALAIVTPTPITTVSPNGQAQKLFGQRTDDVELFKRGDLEGLLSMSGSQDFIDLLRTAANVHLSRLAARPLNIGEFKLSAIDEARDQWSHHSSLPEQHSLFRKAGEARLTNRPASSPRGLIFLGGDIHVGGIFDIFVSKPTYKTSCLISSGISNNAGQTLVIGVHIDEEFAVAPGIHAKLRNLVNDFNFGVVHVIPTGEGAKMLGAVAHAGNSFAVGLDISNLL